MKTIGDLIEINSIGSGGVLAVNNATDTATNKITIENLTTQINSTRLPKYSSDSTEWDTTPTQNSTKPITSGGVYSYIDTMITQAITDSY